MSTSPTEALAPPSPFNLARETLAGFDMLGVPGALLKALRDKPKYSGDYPVMLLPGFGAHDVSMMPLQFFLRRNGFETHLSGMGINAGGRGMIDSSSELSDRWDIDRDRPSNGEFEVPALCDFMVERISKFCETHDTQLHLVGWSLGGYVAREVARDLPDHIMSVTTLGSPIKGGPKYTSVAPVYRRRNMDLDWIEAEIAKRDARPITQPITVIYSKRDGVVGWRAAFDDVSPNATNIDVNVSHMGLGLNAKVWNLVLSGLRSKEAELRTQGV